MVTMSQKLVSAPRAGVAASVHTTELGYASTLVLLSQFTTVRLTCNSLKTSRAELK